MDTELLNRALTDIKNHFRTIKLFAEELEFYTASIYKNSKYNPASKIVEIANLNISLINENLKNLKSKGVI
jgi:hypothetical protein